MASRTNLYKVVNNFNRIRTMLFHSITEVYPPAVTKRKERLMEVIKEQAENASKSKLARKIEVLKGFYTLEMAPPRLNERKQMLADLALVKEFITSGSFRYVTVKQLWLLFLVGLEVYLWFYLGETVGKFHIVGYKV